ncbi:luciferase [Paenibacillus marchantiophytorum]|uniref:Luciferase n=1 Tax=Paenibacillus marchantiophytorum TaxID=1619310 RepID=A0ABQ1ETP0_9BACL|nr:sensor domain-containing protein [Paenibacillus marchantiophytorum]GFZ86810.1 luciferase [Paenibacillus marchantiophytorum]
MNQIIRKHMRNCCFLLLTFLTGLFYFCFFLVGITFGITMAFTLVGLPILSYVLSATSKFVQYERIQTKVYTDISTYDVPSRSRPQGGLWEQVKTELMDGRNWKAIFWLMLKFVIGLICLLCVVLFYVAPFIFLLAPVMYLWMDITFVGMEIRTFGASLLVMLAGVLYLWIGPYLGSILVKWIGGYTRRLVGSFVRNQ